MPGIVGPNFIGALPGGIPPGAGADSGGVFGAS